MQGLVKTGAWMVGTVQSTYLQVVNYNLFFFDTYLHIWNVLPEAQDILH